MSPLEWEYECWKCSNYAILTFFFLIASQNQKVCLSEKSNELPAKYSESQNDEYIELKCLNWAVLFFLVSLSKPFLVFPVFSFFYLCCLHFLRVLSVVFFLLQSFFTFHASCFHLVCLLFWHCWITDFPNTKCFLYI